MITEVKATADHRTPDADGVSYGVEEPGVTFELDRVHNGIVSIYRGDSPAFRVHLSDFLTIAEKFNAITKYRIDMVPFREEDEDE